MIHTFINVRVRYAETDCMGVVHHSNYLVWFEAARISMLDEIGLPYSELEARGFFLPVLAATIEYKRSAYFDDHLVVHLFMREKPRARFQMHHEVCRDDTLLTAGSTKLGFIDKTGKGMRPPEDFLEKIDAAWQPTEPEHD